MTSACVFKDTFRSDTQKFLKFRDSIFEICVHLINSNFTPYFLSSSMLRGRAGKSKHLPPGDACLLTFLYINTSSSNSIQSSSFYYFSSFVPLTIAMNPLLSLDSSCTESDVFHWECSSEESSPIGNNTPAVLISTEPSGASERYTITSSSVASPEPRIVTIDSDSKEPTIPYGFGSQQPWETTHTITNDATFYTDDEPRRVYWDISSSDTFDYNEPRNVSIASSPSSTPPPPRSQKRKPSMGMSFPKKGGVSQHTCEPCGQPLPAKKLP